MNQQSSWLFAAITVCVFHVGVSSQTRSTSASLRGKPVIVRAAPHLDHSLIKLDPGWWRGTTPPPPPPLLKLPPATPYVDGFGAFDVWNETCTTVMTMPANFLATVEFWKKACKDIPTDATYIKLTAGDINDYFMPKAGKTFCDMLTASDQHMWSNGGSGWFAAPASTDGLGGSAAGWLPSMKLSNDNRDTPMFWGTTSNAAGGCCTNDYQSKGKTWGITYTMSYCGKPLELAPVCTPLANVAGTFNADKTYWATTCTAVPMTAGYVRMQMGTQVDYFRPPTGTSYCDMLTANDKHRWSKDGDTWVDPKYVEPAGADKDGLGGSSAPGDATDTRTKVSFWGSNSATDLGGCCYDSAADAAPGFGKSYLMSYCEIPAPTPVNQLVQLLHADEAVAGKLEGELSRLHYRLTNAEYVNVDASGNVSLARSGMFKLEVGAKDQNDELKFFTKKASLLASEMDTVKPQMDGAVKRLKRSFKTSKATAAIAQKVATKKGLQEQEQLNAKIWKLLDPTNKDSLDATESKVRKMEKDFNAFQKVIRDQTKAVMVTKMRREVGRMRKGLHKLGDAGNADTDSTLGVIESDAPLGADLGLDE